MASLEERAAALRRIADPERRAKRAFAEIDRAEKAMDELRRIRAEAVDALARQHASPTDRRHLFGRNWAEAGRRLGISREWARAIGLQAGRD